MRVFDSIHKAQLHREVYTALLNSVLQQPGSKRSLAKRAGITQQYLSYLLHPGMDDLQSFRVPSARIARKITDMLPIEQEQREYLLKHMYLARESTSQIAHTFQTELSAHSLEDLLLELRETHQQANLTVDPHVFRRRYLVVQNICQMLLQYPLLTTYPLYTVEICLILHDVQCLFNQVGDALYHAKLAHAIIDSLSRNDYRRERARFDTFSIEVFQAESRAYSDLWLYREAYEKCLQAEMSDAMRYQPIGSIPRLYRDKLQALCQKPRFALSEAEGLEASVRAICERSGDDLAPRWLFMTRQYLARAYLQHRNLKKAKRLLSALSEDVQVLPHLGSLHQTTFLKTYARFCWDKGDLTEWEYFIKQSLTYAVEAGLAHQISDIQRTYGSTIVPFLKEILAHDIVHTIPFHR